jgi:hypothetical protein
MIIEIRDAALEARLRRQLQSTGLRSVEEVLLHLLETQEEQDRWLSENRESRQLKVHLLNPPRPTRSINGLQIFDLAQQSPKVSSKRVRILGAGQ